MTEDSDKTTRWFQEPTAWLVFLLPLAAVVASLVTIVIAVNNADTPIIDPVRKTGLKIERDSTLLDNARDLGLSATVRFQLESGKVTVRVTGQTVTDDSLRLILVDRGSRDKDTVILVRRNADNTFVANFGANLFGINELILSDTNDSWRLVSGAESLPGPVTLLPAR